MRAISRSSAWRAGWILVGQAASLGGLCWENARTPSAQMEMARARLRLPAGSAGSRATASASV
jgi:hypothetical protein